uniref:Uncharacterized protein n=1 Tax=Kwoniella bestiolae CBS 10118 TaxID=1296100 RepID=A0A1B9G752_9TREE|nr:hypothetical protein I302_04500 [Kwoniella bestiolae CBS 10118]OCF26810.1 hypothetical protein I302_04500 [Kwoniella bestiolae CBS 10118]
MVIIAFWAAATVGFEPYTTFDSNFNRTDDHHWYTPLLPDSVVEGQKGKLCEPVIFNTGSTIQTNGIFRLLSYTITAYDMDGMKNAPNHTVAEYKGSILSDCIVVSVTLTVRVRPGTVVTEAKIRCPPPWPALLSTSYSFDPGVSTSTVGESSAYFDVFWWLGNLGVDLAYRIGEVLEGGNYTMLSADLVNPITLRIKLEWRVHLSCCVEHSPLTYLYSNFHTIVATSSASGDIFDTPPLIYTDLIIPMSNYISAFLGLIYSDLGILQNNIYVNQTSLQQLIHTNDTLVNSSILRDKDLYYANQMLDPENGYRIDPFEGGKNAAGWIVGVVGLTFSIWAGLWQLYMLVVSYFAGRKDERCKLASTGPMLPTRQGSTGSQLTRRGTL